MDASTSASLLGRLRLSPADPAAWELFARRYGPAVHAWCRRWGLQPADAEDVTQTVLVALVGRMREFEYDPAGSFRGWLKTVTHRAWARSLADRRRAPVGAGGDAAGGPLSAAEARDDLAARLEEEYDRELLDRAMSWSPSGSSRTPGRRSGCSPSRGCRGRRWPGGSG